jgi:uncharacterized protein
MVAPNHRLEPAAESGWLTAQPSRSCSHRVRGHHFTSSDRICATGHDCSVPNPSGLGRGRLPELGGLRRSSSRWSHDEDMAERDREESGRPRNARPRDALGRLLPPGSKGVPCIPDDLELPPSQSLAYAQDLLNRGLAFNAHEVLEAAWKSSPDDERPLWQGLTQLAVGITHVQRGNLGGATTLLRRGSGRLGEVDHPTPYSVDIDGLVGWAAALVDELAAGAEISPPRLRPALTKP